MSTALVPGCCKSICHCSEALGELEGVNCLQRPIGLLLKMFVTWLCGCEALHIVIQCRDAPLMKVRCRSKNCPGPDSNYTHFYFATGVLERASRLPVSAAKGGCPEGVVRVQGILHLIIAQISTSLRSDQSLLPVVTEVKYLR